MGSKVKQLERICASRIRENWKAYLYPDDEESYDQSDVGSENNTSYYCNVCEIFFSSKYTFIEHNGTHKFCDIDDNTIVEIPLPVPRHISMQHNTDLCAKSKDLSKEEAARNWIEERRKRFPTKDNIILCETENLKKSQRGEVIKQKWDALKTTNKASTRREIPYNQIVYKTDDYFHSDETYLHSEINILQEEDFSETCFNTQTDFPKETANNILDEDANLCTPILVTNYKIEEENAFPKERMQMEDLRDYKITENAIFKRTFNYAQFCTSTSKNKSNYPTINEISQNPVIECQDKYKYKRNQIVKNKRLEKVPSRYYNILLEKLLSRSIQHERNLIFQSLKYIIDSNFFELSEVKILQTGLTTHES